MTIDAQDMPDSFLNFWALPTAAVNPRTLGLYTWSDPRKVGPYPATADVWKAGRIAKRSAFSAEECVTEMNITPQAAWEMAVWVKG